jgi:predicted acetyltransferase
MTSFEIRRLTEDEVEEAVRHQAVSFGETPDEELHANFQDRAKHGELWGAIDDTHLVGSGLLTAADHWFGGRRVTCQHVGSVAVPPEHRGRGVASAIMRAAVRRGVADGLGLSLLYPATTRLYRKLGWEHAGAYTRYRLAAWEAMPLGPRPPAMRPAHGDADWAAIRACFDRAAVQGSGIATRSDELWEGRRKAAYHYVLDGAEAGTVDAYILFEMTHPPGDWRFTVAIRDWAAATAEGLRAVVGLVASHGSLGKDATFLAAWPEPWSLLIGEQSVRTEGGTFWMARSLDLAQAIDQRGFPPGLSGTVTLAVDDPLLPEAGGPWRLEIADGRGFLKPARAGAVRLHARAVGPLFTGFRDPAQLALAGLVEGPPQALALLGGAFAGPSPTLVDIF